jgi:hypothetical protein
LLADQFWRCQALAKVNGIVITSGIKCLAPVSSVRYFIELMNGLAYNDRSVSKRGRLEAGPPYSKEVKS